MAGFTLLSVAGYAPDFVRHSALKGWALPADVKIEATGQVLSALRRAAGGEPVAVLLDQTQASALATLPFAAELKAVTESPVHSCGHHRPGGLARDRGPCTHAQIRTAQDGTRRGKHRLTGASAFARFRRTQDAGANTVAVTRRPWCAILMVAAAACTARLRPPAPEPHAATPTPTSVDSLAAAIAADAKRSDHDPDSRIRGELAAEAGREAQACLSQAPQSAACLYGSAVSLGLDARAHPTRAGELLKQMLDALGRAETADPNYDEAGPARVRALVLIRAPGWPLGPGDAEAGLTAARRAVALRPSYPPNLLALAEALSKTGNGSAAVENYQRAHDAALALPASGDRDEWLHEADQGLQRR